MGIRLKQLHPEVMDNVKKILSDKDAQLHEYIVKKLDEINISFGLNQPNQVNYFNESVYRNLEKSGFIEFNRKIVPYGTDIQKNVGIWISNIDENISVFEPSTIDGQKRGINIAGQTINLTKGKIGLDHTKMLKLPIAPNLPVFFPEANDIKYDFEAKKKEVQSILVTDDTLEVKLLNEITSFGKVDIDLVEENGEIKEYFVDENEEVYFINKDRRVYKQGSDDFLVDAYKTETITFAEQFDFDLIIENGEKYLIENNKLNVIGNESQETKKEYIQKDGKNIILKGFIKERYVEQNGEYIFTEVNQNLFSTYDIVKKTDNGFAYEDLEFNELSEINYEIKEHDGKKYIQNGDIKLFLEDKKLYYYFPYSKFDIDSEGNIKTDENGNKITVIDETYKKYITEDEFDTESNTIEIEDNLSGETVQREVKYEIVQELVYHVLPVYLNNNELSDINFKNMTYVEKGNESYPILLKNEKLVYYKDGEEKIFSNGKPIYYTDKGTKYYLTNDNKKYFVSKDNKIYFVDSDIDEIYNAKLIKTQEELETDILIYNADYKFYIDENIRKYITNDKNVIIQKTNVDGHLEFKYNNKTIYMRLEEDSKIFFEVSNNKENVLDINYSDVLPIFEEIEKEIYVVANEFSIPFNITNGNVIVQRNDLILEKYKDYSIFADVILYKDLEFNIEEDRGDRFYLKREGKKDIILQLEKRDENDYNNKTGVINYIEEFTGNEYDYIDGHELSGNEKLKFNDIVKKGDKYFKYTGDEIEATDTNNKIKVNELSAFWEDVTVYEVEYERHKNNFKFFAVNKDDKIRFTLIRKILKQDSITGELRAEEEKPYIIEKTILQDGENIIIINDAKFNFDDPNLESYILKVERVTYFDEYSGNRYNRIRLDCTGLQTVSVNEDTALIYNESYFIENNVLKINETEITDKIIVTRFNAAQEELKIDMIAEEDAPKVKVPFEIIKNKFDIVVPKKLDGHEYQWINKSRLPENKKLKNGDVVIDKETLRFFKYIGQEKQIDKQSLLRESMEVKKELIRQYLKIKPNYNATNAKSGYYEIKDYNLWFKETDKKLNELTVELAKEENFTINIDENGNIDLSITLVNDYYNRVITDLIFKITDEFNSKTFENWFKTDLINDNKINDILSILDSDLKQTVIKKIKYNENGEPELDEDGNFVYTYSYTREFNIIKDEDGNIIEYDINGNKVVSKDWVDITVDEVGYYRIGKTFTILNTKEKDELIVRLVNSYADKLTSKKVISKGGDVTFTIDFNIEDEDGKEIEFEVIINQINWDKEDYIQEGQELTLEMIKAGQEYTIRRNDEFELKDIVVLERKDLVFIEVWHEKVNKTGFIFPCGNVQFQGNEFDGIPTTLFDKEFYEEVDGEQVKILDGNKLYCRAYEKESIVYNYNANDVFEETTEEEKSFINKTFIDDDTLGRGWKVQELSKEELDKILSDSDNNLYFDNDELIQIRYRLRVVAIDLFKNYFKGTSQYMSDTLYFQGSSPYISKTFEKQVGFETFGPNRGAPIIKKFRKFVGDKFIHASNENSILYKKGKLFDDALFVNENETELSHNGIIYAIPVAIIHRRNQGVYDEKINANGTAFFINGIHVSEDTQDFADDITGFSLIDENKATLETSSVGRDRKAKFKVMLKWLFDPKYKAGGSMVSKTTYRHDKLLYDEINLNDIIDLRIDANDQRKRIEDLEANVEKGFAELNEFKNTTETNFEIQKDYINTTADLIYNSLNKVELSLTDSINKTKNELDNKIEVLNNNLSRLSADVFTKDITKQILIDSLLGLTEYYKLDSFVDNKKPTKEEIDGMISTFIENMEGPYTKSELIKFLESVLKLFLSEKVYSDTGLDKLIKRLSIKNMNEDENNIYTRNETLELIFDVLSFASRARILPDENATDSNTWSWSAKLYKGWLGTRHLDLEKDFLNNGRMPYIEKTVNFNRMTHSYTDRYGKVWNKGFLAGPSIFGNIHNYHAIYTTWIFVDKPFVIEHVKLNGDDPHAIYINKKVVASNKTCCRDTDYSYSFSYRGWYRIDLIYSEHWGGHNVQLGWNPLDYRDKITMVTTKNMDNLIEFTHQRINNWIYRNNDLISTIIGDNSGYFTKLETKLIIIEGLKRIYENMDEVGISINDNILSTLDSKLESWLDNKDGDGKFSVLGYEVQDGTNPDGTKYKRADEFRPIADLSGNYNTAEMLAIIKKGFELTNGIDPISKDEIKTWVDRLNIKIDGNYRYYTKTQVNALMNDILKYISGLDKTTSYDIKAWIDNHVTNTDFNHGATDKNYVFHDVNGRDLSKESPDGDVYTKEEFLAYIKEKFISIIGAENK